MVSPASLIPVTFERPWLWLLLPLALGVILLAVRFSRVYLPPRRKTLSILLRILLLTLIVGSLTGPQLQLPQRHLNVVFLLDASDSVGQSGIDAAAAWIRRALQHIGPHDKAGVVVFGQDALVEQSLAHLTNLPAIQSVPERGYTDIAQAIRLGLALVASSSGERRLILLSDGNENIGSATAEARIAALSQVQVSVVPIIRGPHSTILVDQVAAPSTLRQGEGFAVSATVQSTVATRGTLYLFSDGALTTQQSVTLHPGENSFSFQHAPETQGFHTFRVRLDVAADPVPQNKEAFTFSYVTGPPRILLVEGKPGEGAAVDRALVAAGMHVDITTPSGIPSDLATLRSYDSVVLVNIPAPALANSTMANLKLFVQNLGGGLVTIGGDASYGPGQYDGTTLDKLLPVSAQVKPRKNLPSTAVVFIIESLENSLGIDISKEAAKAAIGYLTGNDEVAVNDANTGWAVPLQPVTDRVAIDSKIDAMSPGDPSSYATALEESLAVLQKAPAKVKHIILMGDGDAVDSYQALIQRIVAAGITVSVVGTNVQPSDLHRLQDIAQWGHGRYYDGNDPFDIPQLLVRETQVVARPAIVEQSIKPIITGMSSVLSGVPTVSLPVLEGYVATTIKSAAEQIMVSPEGDPLLARWQFGLGHVVSWTSDSGERWTKQWVSWSGFVPFWSRVVQASFPSNLDQNLQVSMQPEDGRVRITVDALSADQTFENFLHTEAMIVAPNAQQETVQLPQVAPGRYQGSVQTPVSGTYLLQIVQKDQQGQVVAVKPSGYAVDYSPEYRDLKTNLPLLETLVHLTNGAVLDQPQRAFSHSSLAARGTTPLWPWLLLFAPLVLLLDVAVRRLRVSPLTLLLAMWRVRRAGGRQLAARDATLTAPASSLRGGGDAGHAAGRLLAARVLRRDGSVVVRDASDSSAVRLAERLQQRRLTEQATAGAPAVLRRDIEGRRRVATRASEMSASEGDGAEASTTHSRLLKAKERMRSDQDR